MKLRQFIFPWHYQLGAILCVAILIAVQCASNAIYTSTKKIAATMCQVSGWKSGDNGRINMLLKCDDGHERVNHDHELALEYLTAASKRQFNCDLYKDDHVLCKLATK